jgi:hypothetical protein
MLIKSGDYVKIVGDCKETNKLYSLVDTMKKYMNNNKVYKVQNVEHDAITIDGYKWAIDDVIRVRSVNKISIKKVEDAPKQPTSPKVTVFKFNEKLLDI